MYSTLTNTINQLDWEQFDYPDRQLILQPLIDFVQQKVKNKEGVNLNFICTHNSRRSHFSQVWAQTAATYFNIPQVSCYSGGTEETALFPKVVETLISQGFEIFKVSESANPVYAVKFDENALPILGFSKKHESPINPVSNFAAIMTCSQADSGCPFIPGAEKRLPITFEDPKVSDDTPDQDEVYAKRSLQIAREMFYVFSKIKG